MSGEHKSPRNAGSAGQGQYPEAQVPGVESPGAPSGSSIPPYPESQIPSVEFSQPTTSGDPFDNNVDMTTQADQLGPTATPGDPRIEKTARSL